MSIARITEITSQSSESFQDAIQKGLARATKTLKNVQSAWIRDQEVILKKDKIESYRVNMKVTFVLDE